MIHSTMLIDLRKTISDQLRYNPALPSYQGEEDDILVFAHSARSAGKQMLFILITLSPSLNLLEIIFSMLMFF